MIQPGIINREDFVFWLSRHGYDIFTAGSIYSEILRTVKESSEKGGRPVTFCIRGIGELTFAVKKEKR